MLHKPTPQRGPDLAVNYKMRTGVVMFLIYAVFYGGFVAINVLKPYYMEAPILFGLNLAVVYGFSLIVAALALALIYTRLCSRKEQEMNPAEKRETM